jgi:hypothetical protein
MATMTETPKPAIRVTPYHDYHAEAHVLSGHLKRPIEQVIERHAPVKLTDRRGGHLTRVTEDVSIEGLVTFTKGKTRVSGSRSLKHNGWVTLSTSIMEGLNVLEVITADRLVAQVSTDHHFENGHIPRVTFLGTQFTNLRISGFPVTVTWDFSVCAEIPANGKCYQQDKTFLGKVKEQTQRIAKGKGLPKEMKDLYDEKLDYIGKLLGTCDEDHKDDRTVHDPITCSLVQSIDVDIPGVQTFGNIMVIQEFGSVALGELVVGERLYDPEDPTDRPSPYFELTSINGKMGCVADGAFAAATTLANGHHKP